MHRNAISTLVNALQAAAVGLLLLAPLLAGDYWRFFFFQMVVMAYLAIGFDLSYSYARILSFMHALFFGLGAYLAVPLVSAAPWSLPATLFVATAAAGLAGLVSGAVLVRMENHNPTIATVILSSIVLLAANSMTSVTGGEDGLIIHARTIGFLGLEIGMGPTMALYYLAAIPLVALVVGRLLLQRTETWMLVRAVAQNETRARQLGFDARAWRLILFAASAAIAGLGGVFYALMMQHVSTSSLEVGLSINAILYAAIGGLGTAFGPLVGVLLIYPITEVISLYFIYVPILVGLVLIIVSLFFGRGVIGTLRSLEDQTDHPRAPDNPAPEAMTHDEAAAGAPSR
ncbi:MULTISPECIES: branched-chain amino acid ABC transporter permease [unclassified Xanthobacter]|uniref:branched-chain amino acid ABC transporter permease n=1 Tax=unclassified Xanthobacter TaxID=2623496 RepID=UPI001EDF3EAC|nr:MULTISPECIES: branched-chain amino acid ABC transporter permease [unclassified Xanthobacter]